MKWPRILTRKWWYDQLFLVDYWRIYKPSKENDPLAALIWGGWTVYGKAYRRECKPAFRNIQGFKIRTLLTDDRYPMTSKPPPERLKYHPDAK